MGRKSSCPRPSPSSGEGETASPSQHSQSGDGAGKVCSNAFSQVPLMPQPRDLFGASGHSLLSGARGMQCLALHRADFGQSPSEPEDVLSNAGQGWVEGRQGICQRECCPTQTEQSARMALAKHLSSRGPALPKGCCPALAVVPGIPSHGGRAWLKRGLPLRDDVGQGSNYY